MDYSLKDPRQKTHDSRIKIGFKDLKKKWSTAKAYFTENKLVIDGHPVMESWEEDYMKILANIATTNGGVVLEVGYGIGLSAAHIQTNSIIKHVIIEANTEVFSRAQKFATNCSTPVELIFGFWEDVTQAIPNNSLSGILFDTYPLVEREIHQNHFSFFKEAYRMLKPNGILTYYSDEIDKFSKVHIQRLKDAGFTKIDSRICKVNPPIDCEYWTSKTILAPIIIK